MTPSAFAASACESFRCASNPSTGNVFRDLGFSKDESEHLLVRADLLIQVQKAIESRRFKQAEAAKLLRVTQPRVSDLLGLSRASSSNQRIEVVRKKLIEMVMNGVAPSEVCER